MTRKRKNQKRKSKLVKIKEKIKIMTMIIEPVQHNYQIILMLKRKYRIILDPSTSIGAAHKSETLDLG